jgi:hypothetical protein
VSFQIRYLVLVLLVENFIPTFIFTSETISAYPVANTDEMRLYVTFIKRIDAAGNLKPGVARKEVEKLRKTIRELGDY